MRKIFLVFLICVGLTSNAQELRCNLVVNAQLTGNENFQVIKTLEKQLNEFVNKTQWTSTTFLPQERIDCNIVLNITEFSGDLYRGNIQVSSSRPVFGSTYSTPLYNVNDKDFSFRYLEFQNLIYNPVQFESNLISVIAFHIHIILGFDGDSFSPNGGQNYFKQAQTILNYSQQENFKGWKLEDGLQSRFVLIDNLLSSAFKEFRGVIYNYHRSGLDMMHESPKNAKNNIISALKELQSLNNRRPNSFLVRTFFDAKADEIEEIFTDGPSVEITDLLTILNKVAPMHSSKWRNIKF
jgi:hypothetical protein